MSKQTYISDHQNFSTTNHLTATQKHTLKKTKAVNQVWVSSNGGKNWELRIAGEENVYKLTLTKEEAIKMWRRLSIDRQLESVRRRFDEVQEKVVAS